MKNIILTLLLVGLTAANATAQFTPEAVTLVGGDYVSHTWDIDTGGAEWLSAGLVVDLSAGDIYQHLSGDNTPPPSSTAK